MKNIIEQLAQELAIKVTQVEKTVELIDAGNTIPFIARYRKEVTGNLSDVVLRDLDERLLYLRNLEKRKEEVLRLIREQEKLTTDLQGKIEKAMILNEVEDLYRPYRTKRRTRAMLAMEKGLKPLADLIWEQELTKEEIGKNAVSYLNTEQEINTIEDVLQGAMDIVAEKVADDAEYRKILRALTLEKGFLTAQAVDEQKKNVYDLYYDYQEALLKIPPHRILAINRGEKEGYLKVKVQTLDNICLHRLQRQIMNQEEGYPYLKTAIADSYKRLIEPAIEREMRNILTEAAEQQAIKVFGQNLKNLLLQAPIKDAVVMGFDPAYRTGCKIAVVDGTGKLLDYTTVYPTKPQNKLAESKQILKKMITDHGVDIIAIGNGTASRESEQIVAELISEIKEKVHYTIVSEAGASVYSASEIANEEYPDINVSIRGAISIARRLQDALAELVKIDPKSVGVGQYQHDVNQGQLKSALNGVVEDAVNKVGVDLNTASSALLQHIAGISKSIAKNIVDYREEKGQFQNRQELLKVKRLGPAAFQQSAGFLRITHGEHALDNTAVHPESYEDTMRFLSCLHYTLEEVQGGCLQDIEERIMAYEDKSDFSESKSHGKTLTDLAALKNLQLNKQKTGNTQSKKEKIAKKMERLAQELEIGFLTLQDIVEELKKPGRDPRDEMVKPLFRTDVLELEDLKKDMILTGTVRNVIDFGAFVDIGLKNDGLIHISELSDQFVKDPMKVVSVGDEVKVRVIGIDEKRKRISLSLKGMQTNS